MEPLTGERRAKKRLVLDANILLRGVLGVRVRELLQTYGDSINFFAPDLCFYDARRLVTELADERAFDPEPALILMDRLSDVVDSLDRFFYLEHEVAARSRISARDPDDWPIVAAALLLGCPIWTEDRDFFGSGVATWTTATVEIYLRGE